MGKIIVFGACGNVGQYFIDYLKSKTKEEDIVAVDIQCSGYIEKSGVKFFKVDINKIEDFRQLLAIEGVDAVVDLIGPMPARMTGYHPEEYVQTNIVGTFHVAQYCVDAKIKKMIYAKSFCDILDRSEEEPVLRAEAEPRFDYGNQHAIYSVSQISAFELLKCMHAYYGLKVTAFRLPTVYLWSRNDMYNVKGVPKKKMYRELIDGATAGKQLEIWGDPERRKDMLYVKDLCQLLYKACITDKGDGLYNAGTGVGITLREQIQGIIDVFDDKRRCSVIYCPEKDNAPQYIMDISKTVRDFGYRPEYSYIGMLVDMKHERELNRF